MENNNAFIKDLLESIAHSMRQNEISRLSLLSERIKLLAISGRTKEQGDRLTEISKALAQLNKDKAQLEETELMIKSQNDIINEKVPTKMAEPRSRNAIPAETAEADQVQQPAARNLPPLPKFSGRSESVDSFLSEFEGLLLANSIPIWQYPGALLAATYTTERDWVRQNIVEQGLQWSEAKLIFRSHFESPDLEITCLAKLLRAKAQGRSVREFSDAFIHEFSLIRKYDARLALERFTMLVYLNGLDNYHIRSGAQRIWAVQFDSMTLEQLTKASVTFDALSRPLCDNCSFRS